MGRNWQVGMFVYISSLSWNRIHNAHNCRSWLTNKYIHSLTEAGPCVVIPRGGGGGGGGGGGRRREGARSQMLLIIIIQPGGGGGDKKYIIFTSV